ncbi:MAG: hypothetical protein LQ346_001409 [Caloplaca aetnensis]|nr:MAG: hypothetical protein LQ346_001409 [Caloplaca aetnensis]
MERRRCNHHDLDDPLSTLECLSSVVDPKKSATNKNRYVVASQEEEVRRFCRGVKGVPLVYVKRSVMILEPMAESTIGVKEGIERDKFRTGLRARPGKRKREDEEEKGAGGEGTDDKGGGYDGVGFEQKSTKQKRTRGPKGPNPLSVKKSKKGKAEGPEEETGSTDLVAEEPGGQPANTGVIVARNPDDTEVQSGKRKRKRKHKPGNLDELKRELAEGERLSS